MNTFRGEEQYRVNKNYHQAQEKRAEQLRQISKAEKKQARKSVNIIHVISQILVSIK